jgi:shikimate dehydrogenase
MSASNKSYLAGLLGRGIGASRSPEMHEREAASLGVPLVYRSIDFDKLAYEDDRLEDVIRALQAIGFDGTNVTHPFKQQVLASLDTVSPDATALGAVNTVVFRDGARHGFNTDWTGFRANMLLALPGIALRRVAQIGCGGAGSAIAYALLSMGVRELRVVDPDRDKAEAMAGRIGIHFPDQTVVVVASAEAALDVADGLVQASPIGMASHPGMPFPP